MNISGEFWDFLTGATVRQKHLPGKHDQKRHGWRYGSIDAARRSMRGRSAEERAEYRKRAGMPEAKKIEKPKKPSETKAADFGNLDAQPGTASPFEIGETYSGYFLSDVGNKVEVRIGVRRVTEGSEKQRAWADKIKMDTMRMVDQEMARSGRVYEKKGIPAQRLSAFYRLRNKVLQTLNSITDARTIIDRVRGSENTETLVKNLGIDISEFSPGK